VYSAHGVGKLSLSKTQTRQYRCSPPRTGLTTTVLNVAVDGDYATLNRAFPAGLPVADRVTLSMDKDALLARASNCLWSHHGQPRSWWTTSPMLPRLSFRQGHDIELMSEKEILHFGPALGPEQAGDKGSKQMEACEHRPILR
jgi:hypothetical protein